jgi:ankyrin repeat protein
MDAVNATNVTSDIEEDKAEILELVTRLEQLQRDNIQPDIGDTFMLQRYINELTTYAGSAYHRSVLDPQEQGNNVGLQNSRKYVEHSNSDAKSHIVDRRYSQQSSVEDIAMEKSTKYDSWAPLSRDDTAITASPDSNVIQPENLHHSPMKVESKSGQVKETPGSSPDGVSRPVPAQPIEVKDEEHASYYKSITNPSTSPGLKDPSGSINGKEISSTSPNHFSNSNQSEEKENPVSIQIGSNGQAPFPLLNAAGNGHIEIVKALLKDNLDVNARVESHNLTALHEAARGGHCEIIELLLDHGAEIESQAVPDGWTPLLRAILYSQIEAALVLLERGANANFRSKGNWTALHIAAQNGSPSLVRELVSKGVDVDVRNAKHGHTPLYLASFDGQTGIVSALLASGASPNNKSKAGESPLHASADKGHLAVVQLLINSGADVNSRTKDGWTCLHCAAESGQIDTMKALIQEGAEIDSKGGKLSETALMLASYQGHVKAASLLVEHGAAVGLKNSNGYTALKIAEQHGNGDMVLLLMKKTKRRWMRGN